ncbi:MAG: hypothetical protein RLZZ628_2169 [Bacteroidota bacterium]
MALNMLNQYKGKDVTKIIGIKIKIIGTPIKNCVNLEN